MGQVRCCVCLCSPSNVHTGLCACVTMCASVYVCVWVFVKEMERVCYPCFTFTFRRIQRLVVVVVLFNNVSATFLSD